MDSHNLLAHQGHRLLQVGVALLLFTSFEGFAIPHLNSPRIALSVHTLGTFQAILLLGLGLLWNKLKLSVLAARVAFWTLLYSAFAILAAYVIAAISGVGNETIILMGELPHGLHHGSASQETLIKVLAYTSVVGIASFAIILWGLRLKVASLSIQL